MKKFYDVIFAGAGLANCLAAWRLSQVRPDVEFLLLDKGDTFGGNHTWSFHDSDVSSLDFSWLNPLISKSWEGTEVRFPSYQRTVSGGYHAIRSSHLHEVLSAAFYYQKGLGTDVRDVFDDSVVLANGTTVHATCVVDGRGWQAPAGATFGYQKFLGIELTLKAPHGLTRPVIMDATVPQEDGFRFFYTLPWTDRSVLLEDTHYSSSPDVDEARYRREVLAHAVRQRWDVGAMGRVEIGSLPIPLDDVPPPAQAGVVSSGLRAGLFHATTGYSLPEAVKFAEAFAHSTDFSGDVMSRWAAERALRHGRDQRFFRLLNRLLFRAADPEQRYRVLESFYRRPDALISRFYAGALSPLDRLRFFTGRPPVPVTRAFRELIGYVTAA